jgi:hypothetical protein
MVNLHTLNAMYSGGQNINVITHQKKKTKKQKKQANIDQGASCKIIPHGISKVLWS